MKIFISHASANKEYGNALVELLKGIGVKDEEIIFTSNVAYGIPISQNIFKWLKSQISEKPFVVYLLSKEYYASTACLNEMGAAWIVENEHAVIFTPNFDSNSREFQNGALDPREIGFHFNDEERLLSFIQQLGGNFNTSKNPVIINQRLKHYLVQVNSVAVPKGTIPTIESIPEVEISKKVEFKNDPIATKSIVAKKMTTVDKGIYSKFLYEINAGKLKDEELILLHYIIETSKVKLMTGWQENSEITAIRVWEDISELNSTLSNNYGAVIRRFELRGYTEVSAVTSSGNPKEAKLKSEIESNIIDLPAEVLEIINNAITKNNSTVNGAGNHFAF